MTDIKLSPEDAAKRVREALERIQDDLPAVANVVTAFKDLLVEQAFFKAELSDETEFPLPDADPERFRQGVPLADKETFLVSGDEFRNAAKRIIPTMEKGLPKIGKELSVIRTALLDGSLDAEAAVDRLLDGKPEDIAKSAARLQVDPDILEFVMAQLVKPFAVKRAESMTPLPSELHWFKGYCPICGSWPAISFLKEEGQRWLKCSFCSHEWRFIRTECPFCENDDFDTMRRFFSEEREFERVEVCDKCKRYVVSLDLRERADDPVMEVAALGLVYLDILAQDKGYWPGAVTAWNVMGADSAG